MSTIVTRAGKGSALTHNEVDANFTNLNTDKLQSGNTAAALTITSATINGGAINSTTVGATTPSTGAFTTLSASSTSTLNGTTIPASSTLLVSGGALGTPSSGTVTNLTGTASININGTVGATTSNTGAFTTLSATGVTTVQAGTVSAPAITTSGDTNTGIFFPAADTIAFSEGGVESMRIDSSGNVGIGTSSPVRQLAVGTPNGGVGTAINIGSGTSSLGTLEFGDGATGDDRFRGYVQYSHSDNSLRFGTDATERARIEINGNLLVGKTSNTSAGINAKNIQGAAEIISCGSVAGIAWENRSGGVTTTSNWYMWYNTGGTNYLYNGSGNIASINGSTGVYTALSDASKKKDFEPSLIGLDAVLNLKPTLYRMKDAAENSTKELGFIAQEVKDVIPQAYVETNSEDANGNPYTFIGLSDRPILAAVTKAIQEQQQMIETLQAKVAALENR
jgi:hypothetical protein